MRMAKKKQAINKFKVIADEGEFYSEKAKAYLKELALFCKYQKVL